jgi:SDR family mycofactocin-dependent oxidoreductase
MGQLDGRVALITGGGRGQGRAHALALAEAGAAVVVIDGPAAMSSVSYALAGADDLTETVALVTASGGRAMGMRADVRSRDEVDAAVARTVSEFGSLDILAANAGICTAAPVTEMSDEMWAETLATNLTGVFHSIRAVLPHMLARKWGRIVATASMAGRGGSPNLAHYSASKFGVIGLVKSVALEVAGQGVTVNALCPSTVNTAMIHHEANYRLFCPELENPTREQAVERFGRLNPLHQPWMEPEAIARELVHLVTDPGYTTGAVVELGMGISAKKS